MEIMQSEQRRKLMKKNEQSLRLEYTNICIMRLPEGKEREKGGGVAGRGM